MKLEKNAADINSYVMLSIPNYLRTNRDAKDLFKKDMYKFLFFYKMKKAAELFNIEINYYSEKDGVITYTPHNDQVSTNNVLKIYVESDGTGFILLTDYHDDDIMEIEEEGGYEETKEEKEVVSNKRPREHSLEDNHEDKKTKLSITDNEFDDQMIGFCNEISKSLSFPGISIEYIYSSVNMVWELLEYSINYMVDNNINITNILLNDMLDYGETHQMGRLALSHRHSGDPDDNDGGAGGGSSAGVIFPEDYNGPLIGGAIHLSPSNNTIAQDH